MFCEKQIFFHAYNAILLNCISFCLSFPPFFPSFLLFSFYFLIYFIFFFCTFWSRSNIGNVYVALTFPGGHNLPVFFIEKYIICNFPWVFQEICRATSKLLLSTTHRNTHKSWNWRNFNERFFHRYVVLNLIRTRERENRWCDAKMVKNHLAGSCVLVRFYGDLFHCNTRGISRIERN